MTILDEIVEYKKSLLATNYYETKMYQGNGMEGTPIQEISKEATSFSDGSLTFVLRLHLREMPVRETRTIEC